MRIDNNSVCWRIVNFQGMVSLDEFPRPVGTNPLIEGSEWTPWHKLAPHVHYTEDGLFDSVHFIGTLNEGLVLVKNLSNSISPNGVDRNIADLLAEPSI